MLNVASTALIFALGTAFHRGHFSGGSLALAGLILAYPLMFVSVFINTAIAAAAAAALEGSSLSLAQALAVPARRVGRVALWALIATAVGVILEQIASRLPLAGSIASRLGGLAWSLASLFAIPILALDDCSAPECLRRSAHIVKARWGEGISGNVMITAWMVIAIVPAAIVLGIGVGVSHNQPVLRDAVIVLAVVAFVAALAIGAVVRQTFSVALYRYATDHPGQGPFEQHDLRSPFKAKRGLFG
jgi:hypothetical protein